MTERGKKRGERTREAILDAAEAIFAAHGFDGARIDRIAEISGYNKTLIFRYFGDKLGLYARVIKRIDQHVHDLMMHMVAPLIADETLVLDRKSLRNFLKAALGDFFDYMVEHPQVMRMIVWEHAEGWQTYTKLASLFELKELEQLETFLARIRKAGFFRSDFDPIVLLMLAEQICWSYATSLPFYQLVLPRQDFTSAESRAWAREQLIEFIVGGILLDSPEQSGSVGSSSAS